MGEYNGKLSKAIVAIERAVAMLMLKSENPWNAKTMACTPVFADCNFD